ncbi:MAG: hypothetical protein A3B16_00035 [Candidatus Zambryskibacteria bacterium RIFCSPLOWO2_01_FULL_45_43]|uniref:Addiction module toxin RelE n=1 Tax=Candidatus Zambryskibacteria bacterium RIFCSPLOWO2_01_FULL_45_43 TaxID=1802762 RepID=A0A1G2U630_9BACT|nr:MAG: hypothetical protein A3B16_00035 [Candidatus Zambryskibacteria bacterium RIFCSPLOWO2_01_FULL_45_43]
MQHLLHTSFDKKHKKLSKKLQLKIAERLVLFDQNPFDKILDNHPLHGEFEGYRSINITSDYRAVFLIHQEVAIFTDIGTHSELFGK